MTPLITRSMAVIASLLLLLSRTVSSACLNPSVTHSSHTSSEAATATSTVFIIAFDLTCGGEDETSLKPNLFAVLASGGKPVSGIHSVAKSGAGYQVSFSGDHAQLPRGDYSVRIYDDEGFAALKKAQRASGDEEAPAAVSPVATIAVEHAGVWKGTWIPSETTTLVLFCCAFYLAHSAKSRIEAE